jgi:hypothetical protein
MMFTSAIRQLKSGFSGPPPGRGKHARARAGCGLSQKRRYQPRAELLEVRTVPTVSVLQNFPDINFGAAADSTPPDTMMAVGPNSVVGAVNVALTITNKTGGARSTETFATFFSSILPAGHGFSDPYTLYDDQAGRFYVAILDFARDAAGNPLATNSALDFAVSTSNSPTTLSTTGLAPDWHVFARITSVNEGDAYFPDFPKLGWNNDAVFVSTNQFGASFHNLITAITKSSILALGALTTHQTSISIPDQRNIYIPARMHNESVGNLEYLVQCPETGGSSTTVNVVKETGYNSGAGALAPTPITVTAYNNSPGVPGLTFQIDDRILSVDWIDNGTTQHMVASQDVGEGSPSLNLARWYEFNAPTAASPAPSLLQEQDITAGTGVSTSYPSVAINGCDDIAMTFVANGGTPTAQPTSMYVTERLSTDALNTTQTPVLIKAGAALAGASRGGDYSATEFDPTTPAGFWSANEFQFDTSGLNTHWGTQIAEYNIPALTVTAPANQTAVEGAAKSFALGSFADDMCAGPWTVMVSWGDGSMDSFSVTTADGLGMRSHTFGEEGTKTVTVKVTNSLGVSDSKSFTVTVSDPAVVATGVPVSAVEGAAFTSKLVAAFTDPGGPELSPSVAANYSATINWGDSTPPTTATISPPVTVNVFSGHTTTGGGTPYSNLVGTITSPDIQFATSTGFNWHPFGLSAFGADLTGLFVVAASGSYTFTLNSDDGSLLFIDGNLVVNNGGPHPPQSVAGTTSLTAGVHSFEVQFFEDFGGQSGLDLTLPSGVSYAFDVRGDHTYGEEGTYTVTTTIHHGTAPDATATATATVSDPAVLATGVAVSAKECIAFQAPVATFTDPGGAEPNPFDPVDGIPSHYTASIDFGDGKGPSAGTITYVGGVGSTTGVFTVTGIHTFDEEGTFTVTTTINHEGVITVAHSTATVRDNFGLLLLDPTDDKSLMVDGKGTVTVNNCGAIVVDSSDPRAIFLSGDAVVTATEADVGLGGGAVTHGHAVLNLLEPEFNQEAATADPFALPLPPAPANHFPAVQVSTGAVTLSPGTYDGGIQVTGDASVTLLPGIYYMNGGGFSVSGQGSVTGSGVLIVNAPTGPSDQITFDGQASVNLTAISGLAPGLAPYNHFTIFQDPASANTVMITGQASLTMTGILYAPAALLKIDGDGSAVVSTDTNPTGGIVVARDAMVTGNGSLIINADPPDFIVPADAGSASATAPASAAAVLAPPSGAARATQPIGPVVASTDFASVQAALARNGSVPAAVMVAGTLSPSAPGVPVTATTVSPAAAPAVVLSPANLRGAGNTEADGTSDVPIIPTAQQPAPPLAPATPSPAGERSDWLPSQAYDAVFAGDDWALVGIVGDGAAALGAADGAALTPSLLGALGVALGLPGLRGAGRREDEERRRRSLLQ